MHDTRSKIEAARNDFEQRRHAIFYNAYLRIHGLLTPRQQTLFDERFVPSSLRNEARAQHHTRAMPAPSASATVP
jgi:hypothetical protein